MGQSGAQRRETVSLYNSMLTCLDDWVNERNITSSFCRYEGPINMSAFALLCGRYVLRSEQQATLLTDSYHKATEIESLYPMFFSKASYNQRSSSTSPLPTQQAHAFLVFGPENTSSTTYSSWAQALPPADIQSDFRTQGPIIVCYPESSESRTFLLDGGFQATWLSLTLHFFSPPAGHNQ